MENAHRLTSYAEHVWFWNLAYFDKYYFKGIFDNFVFPDGTEPNWETVHWLQERFITWFANERNKNYLTFPVETLSLLDDGTKYKDEEAVDFICKMMEKGHAPFIYRSGNVDSLSSCCFDGKQEVLIKTKNDVKLLPFKELYDLKLSSSLYPKVFHNGSWVNGKLIRLNRRNMYKVTTVNNKVLYVTDNHLNPTNRGDIYTKDLTIDDYLLFNTNALDTFSEKDEKFTYEEGFLIGAYLGDGSINKNEIEMSFNKEKYETGIDKLNKAIHDLNESAKFELSKTYNNVYPLRISSQKIAEFIRRFVHGNYSYEKELDLYCLLQSRIFRQGILEGYYHTDGGNSNRIYTTSENLIKQIEVLITSLGMNSIIDVVDRTDENNCNYPTYCIRWYAPMNKRNLKDLFIVKNNSIYYKIKSIEPYESTDEFVYCFEMDEKEPYFTLPNGVITHNCRLRNEISDNTFSYTLGAGGVSTGSKSVITININRLVQNATKNGIDISDAITSQVKKIHKYLTAHNQIIKENFESKLMPVYDAGYISLEKQFLTIGINGFVEGAEFLGIDISPNEKYMEYAEKILKPIYDLNKRDKTKEIMFNTEFVPAENLGIKNAKWDKEDGYVVPRDCYNSYFYKVEDKSTNILDKLILHGRDFTRYLDGGSALHDNQRELLTAEQYKKILNNAIKTQCPYLTFNTPATICNTCGFIDKTGKHDKCVKCGSDDVDYETRIIGYHKRVSKFSEHRQQEESRRYYE